jgi:hypothetical protein
MEGIRKFFSKLIPFDDFLSFVGTIEELQTAGGGVVGPTSAAFDGPLDDFISDQAEVVREKLRRISAGAKSQSEAIVASLTATASLPERLNRIPERERRLSAEQDELIRARDHLVLAEALVDYRQDMSNRIQKAGDEEAKQRAAQRLQEARTMLAEARKRVEDLDARVQAESGASQSFFFDTLGDALLEVADAKLAELAVFEQTADEMLAVLQQHLPDYEERIVPVLRGKIEEYDRVVID